MPTSTIQFISQTKLTELARGRDLLQAEYQQLLNEASQSTGLQKLRILNDGLRKILVAGKPLHRQLPNLSILLSECSPSPVLTQFWTEKLEAEIARGRMRADTVYLFGALLGEWDSQDDAKTAWLDEKRQAHVNLLSEATNPPPRAPSLRILNDVLSRFIEHRSRVQNAISKSLQDLAEGKVRSSFGLNWIADNAHHPASVRAEAKRFCQDSVLEQELNDSLQVAMRDPRQWRWPPGGVKARTLWTRNKWRLYPTLSLVELAMLEGITECWVGDIEKCYSSQAHLVNRRSRLEYLTELGAPEVITLNEQRMLKTAEEAIDLGWYESFDPWDGLPIIREDVSCTGIVAIRAEKQAEMRDSRAGGYYADAGVNPMVRLVHAEVQALRAAYPDKPLHVVKLDIRNYFASVSHEVLLTMLRGLGMDDSGLQFASRFLKVPYDVDGEIKIAERGVPMEQRFSHWLCEWLLRLLELYVHSKANVRIIRQIDDICLLTATTDDAETAWAAANEFLVDCGLQVNDGKCGSTVLGDEPPAGLPVDAPRWGMLELTADGNWLTHKATFQRFLDDTRQLVDAKGAVLSKVMAYNQHLKFLTSSLGLAMDLGDQHRQSVNESLQVFDQHFFSDDVGIAQGILQTISARFSGQAIELCESWLAWPITAGGLSLRLANVLGGQYQLAYEKRRQQRKKVPDSRPENWQNGKNEWSEFYEDQLTTLEPAECGESAAMKSMVQSFIARGKQISGGEQEGLSQYWRWVLSIHGPAILDLFGTFEFLLTDLVPLQLIKEKLMQEDAED